MRENPAGDTANPLPATINQTFPKGAALAKWLVNVQASTVLGSLDLVYPRDNLQAVNAEIAREWITLDNPNFPNAPKAVQYMSFNAPIGAAEDQVCGRDVYTNLHVASVDNNNTANDLGFPASCELRALSPQEKAMAFMLFDLSSCIMSSSRSRRNSLRSGSLAGSRSQISESSQRRMPPVMPSTLSNRVTLAGRSTLMCSALPPPMNR
jgi:hypothetical protein